MIELEVINVGRRVRFKEAPAELGVAYDFDFGKGCHSKELVYELTGASYETVSAHDTRFLADLCLNYHGTRYVFDRLAVRQDHGYYNDSVDTYIQFVYKITE